MCVCHVHVLVYFGQFHVCTSTNSRTGLEHSPSESPLHQSAMCIWPGHLMWLLLARLLLLLLLFCLFLCVPWYKTFWLERTRASIYTGKIACIRRAITRAATREPQRLNELLANVHMAGQNASRPCAHNTYNEIFGGFLVSLSLALGCWCAPVCVCLALFGWWPPNSKYDCHQMGDSD